MATKVEIVKKQAGPFGDTGGTGEARPLSLGEILATGGTGAVRDVPGRWWFSPLQPIKPVAPKDLRPRRFPFQPGANIIWQPGAEDTGTVGFGILRDFADSWDLLRILLETRKDQMARMQWEIRTVPKPNEAPKDTKERHQNNPHVQQISNFLKRPDGVTDWATWLRMLLEDMYVLDAPSIYMARDTKGRVASLQVIDGATIAKMITDQGFTPPPPSVAYQQVLYGIPALDLTTDDLHYPIRNPRTWKRYGYGAIEQIMVTIAIGLRRQKFSLAYYTEGNMPEALCFLPPGIPVEKVREIQDWFDSVLAGDLSRRRRLTFLPTWGADEKGAKPNVVFTKSELLKDEMDDWLARIVCAQFSISTSTLLKQMNRAAAASQSDTAKEEGLEPIMRWVAESVINPIIQQKMGFDDVEFAWQQVREVDVLKQATVDKTYVTSGIKTINETREALGLDPADNPEADQLGFLTPNGFVALSDKPQTVGGTGPGGGSPPSPDGGDTPNPQGKKPPEGGGGGQASPAKKAFLDGDRYAVDGTQTADGGWIRNPLPRPETKTAKTVGCRRLNFKIIRAYGTEEDLPVAELVSMQRFMNVDHFKRYFRNPASPSRKNGGWINPSVLIARAGGELVVVDGNHRVVATRERGDLTIKATLVDMDAAFSDASAIQKSGEDDFAAAVRAAKRKLAEADKAAPVQKQERIEKRPYGCLMLYLSTEDAARIREFQEMFEPEHLAQGGAPSNPHVTLKYGFDPAEVGEDKIAAIVAGLAPVTSTVREVGLFPENKDGVPLICLLDSEELQAAHAQLNDLPNHDEHPVYMPHITLAYLKPEFVDEYLEAANERFEGMTVRLAQAWYGRPDDTTFPMAMGKANKADKVAAPSALLPETIAVDFDGTLAKQPEGDYSPTAIGEIGPDQQRMIDRVKAWLAEGKQVVILTARAWTDGTPERNQLVAAAKEAIQAFCVEQFGRALEVTNEKTPSMIQIWDDLAHNPVGKATIAAGGSQGAPGTGDGTNVQPAASDATGADLARAVAPLGKGDVEGHEFHGNQWTEGAGGGTSPALEKDLERWTVGEHQSVQDEAETAIKAGRPEDSPIVMAIREGKVDAPLYRGIHVPPDDEVLNLERGQTVQLMPQSFSLDKKIAKSFATGKGPGLNAMPGWKGVTFETTKTGNSGPTRGLVVGEKSFFEGGDQREVITGGKFWVAQVKDTAYGKHIIIQQNGVF